MHERQITTLCTSNLKNYRKKNGLRLTSMYQYWFTSYDKCTVVVQDLNIRGNGVRGILEVCIIFAAFS